MSRPVGLETNVGVCLREVQISLCWSPDQQTGVGLLRQAKVNFVHNATMSRAVSLETNGGMCLREVQISAFVGLQTNKQESDCFDRLRSTSYITQERAGPLAWRPTGA